MYREDRLSVFSVHHVSYPIVCISYPIMRLYYPIVRVSYPIVRLFYLLVSLSYPIVYHVKVNVVGAA